MADRSPLPPYAGSLLQGVPYNILGSGMCQVTSALNSMACPPGGDGSSPLEQFLAFKPDGSAGPIEAGSSMLLQSVQTGSFCRVVQQLTQQRLVCDQSSQAAATPVTYTGTGLAYNGQIFNDPGAGQPLSLGGPGQQGTLLPAPIPTNTPVSVSVNGRGYVRVDHAASYAHVGRGDGTSPPELFLVQDPADPAARKLVRPGQEALLVSLQTGMYCRLALFTGDPDREVATQRASPPRSLLSSTRPPPPQQRAQRSPRASPALSTRARTPPPAPAPRQRRQQALKAPAGSRAVSHPPPRTLSARAGNSPVETASLPAGSIRPLATSRPAAPARPARLGWSPPSQTGSRPAAAPSSSSPQRAVSSTGGTAVLWGVLADQLSPRQATLLTYTVTGLTYQSTALQAKDVMFPLLWSNSSSAGGVSQDGLSPVAFKPVPGRSTI